MSACLEGLLYVVVLGKQNIWIKKRCFTCNNFYW